MNYQRMNLVGKVTDDPTRQRLEEGGEEYTLFTVRVREWQEEPVLLPVAAFGKLGERVAVHVRKGREVVVEGRLKMNGNRLGVVAERVGIKRKSAKKHSGV